MCAEALCGAPTCAGSVWCKQHAWHDAVAQHLPPPPAGALLIEEYYQGDGAGHGAGASGPGGESAVAWLDRVAGIVCVCTDRAPGPHNVVVFGCVQGVKHGDSGNWGIAGSGAGMGALLGLWPAKGDVAFALREPADAVSFDVICRADRGGIELRVDALSGGAASGSGAPSSQEAVVNCAALRGVGGGGDLDAAAAAAAAAAAWGALRVVDSTAVRTTHGPVRVSLEGEAGVGIDAVIIRQAPALPGCGVDGFLLERSWAAVVPAAEEVAGAAGRNGSCGGAAAAVAVAVAAAAPLAPPPATAAVPGSGDDEDDTSSSSDDEEDVR